jgi:competence protein ComFC
MIYQFKYKPHITDLRHFMTDLFYEGLIQKDLFYKVFTPKSVFVPIPLYKSKLKNRGYNQAQLLAEGLEKKLGVKILPLLERTRNTGTQFKLSKDEREDNIKGAFMIRKDFLTKPPKVVFLIDDIVTSGATLKEAAKVLKKAGVEKVWGLTLAHGK